jgi:hypothetical protein
MVYLKNDIKTKFKGMNVSPAGSYGITLMVFER